VSLGMVARWPHGNERCVADALSKVIDRGYACSGSMKCSFPRVWHCERILIEHPPTIEAEVVDLVDVPMIVNPLEIATLHSWRNNLGDGGQRSPEPRERCQQTVASLRVAFGRRVGKPKIVGDKQ
jgi:hypothetical protein